MYILTYWTVKLLYTKVQKWGNSKGIRIPKDILESVGLNENDKVEIKVKNGSLVIIPVKKHKTLKERIAEYNGDYKCEEWDTGNPNGKEVF